jgi:molybdenum cofactor cytidylyltransferase
MENKLTAIILSAGFSERMGNPKALLKWDHSTTFIEKIINEFHQFGCGNIICIINDKIELFCKELKTEQDIKFIVNQHPELGRFGSIKLGAAEAAGSDYCFIHNVDNPFVNIKTIEKLYSERAPNAWCSPVYSGKSGHPVLLPNVILNKINEVDNPDTILSDILNKFPVIRVEVEDDSILRNINTPEEYLNYIKLNL